MRTVRSLAGALSVALLLPAVSTAAHAQSERLFRDSWFWGVKGGASSFRTMAMRSGSIAPQAGVEWLITRTRFGLDLSLDQAFFSEKAVLFDRMGSQHDIGIKDLRRFTAQGFFFPRNFGALRPYAGLGVALNMIHQTTLTNDFDDIQQVEDVSDVLRERKDRASFIMTAGTQYQIGRIHPFVQASYMPSHVGFLLNARPTYFIEGGIRFNFGSAIERID